ncbi:MAG: LytTR family DNA-binding domain-containing protein, partial [Acidobacteriota bacterium]
ERLAIKSGERVVLLSVDEIDWIEAADNYARIHAGKESHLLHATMNSLESKLDPAKFLRVHRSVIVNIKSIRELHPLFHGEYRLALKSGDEITTGRSYRNRLQQILKNSF